MTQRPTITPARFALDTESLKDSSIQALNQPYQAAINSYRNSLRSLLPGSEQDGVAIPSRRLNRALLAVTPILGTGFEWMQDVQAARALIVHPPDGSTQDLPVEQVATIVRGWASHWIEQINADPRFRQGDPDNRERLRAAQIFRTALQNATDTQWQTLSLDTLVKNLDSTSFKAIPALLAAMLHGQTCDIEGHPVKWRRVIGDGMHAEVQSQPLAASGRKEDGYFSYVLSIELQTDVGSILPWIHLRPSIRRYADAKVVETNYGRNVAILVGANRARIDDYPIDSSLVYLSASIEDHQDPVTADWDDTLAALLGRLGARRLKPAGQVLTDAPRDWTPQEGEDEYYVVHAEGMEYDNDVEGDELESGMQFSEGALLISAVLALLPCLGAGPAFARDDPFNDEMLPSRKPDTARTLGDLKVPHSQNIERNQERAEERTESREVLEEAIRRAAAGQPVHVTLITFEADALAVLEQALRQQFYLDEGQAFPEVLDISYASLGPSDMHLIEPLDRQGTHWQTNWAAFERRMRQAFQDKMQAWQTFLEANVHRESNVWNLVLIQLPPFRVKGQHPKQGIKGAVREACDRLGLSSQMVVKPRLKHHRWRNQMEPSHNASQAVADLLFRQTGALFDEPPRLFVRAGISSELASRLQILAIHLSTNRKPSIKYPTAVFLKPNGHFDVVAPGMSVERESLLVAGPEIGKAFARERIRLLGSRRTAGSVLQYGSADLVEFLQSLLLDLQSPTLVLIDALNWRNHDVWPQLRNGDLTTKLNVLDFSNSRNKSGTVVQREESRVDNLLGIMRLRSRDEMPYYVTSGRQWDRMIPDRQGRELQDLLHLTGFTDPSAKSPHYFSVGGLSVTNVEQNKRDVAFTTMVSGEAGKIPVRHARIVEMVPFFLRQDFQNNWLLLCRVAHMLRISPAWEHANIIYPLPMHLAGSLVKDRFCILGES